ncbi:alanine racemase [Castellaniella defragrans]|uniref:D-serine deaminase-like pyridoxal phosphate-dependent protein n=1 Tax=Castellaniella defragrans TaxID=75697 RepID=A0A7W9TSI5_CASDE|nr:alanine racemase [Castellaniella defragrans]KAB0611879.1 DSD1 family PLP-dependent enzyme [Castellaniella defragrans]MBB6084722.1 D-serine deaminase-like pyridoxal phosphate-dependent protein [Castellaniella defragrans]
MRSPGRRRLLLSAGALALGGAAALRPRDRGLAHDPYFSRLTDALRQAGIAVPTLIIDRERMLENAGRLRSDLRGRLDLRLVAKSLPSLPLLQDLAHATGSQGLMSFSLPHLQHLAAHLPDERQLLGKPLPADAAARFLREARARDRRPPRVQWLIDTPERLLQYRALSQGLDLPLDINLEIDVGLHRGGIDDPRGLQRIIDILRDSPRLRWSGLMGYDAHVAKLPDVAGLRAQADRHAKQRYADFLDRMLRAFPATDPRGLTLNTGGSLTYRNHDGQGAAREVAVGSALLKPSDFDTEPLAGYRPAVFIATPVLKAAPFRPPQGVEWLGPVLRAWDPNSRQAYMIYGGHWMADPVSPPGIEANALYGPSSNQQVLTGSGRQALGPDDFIFFRPRQSEALLLQFGDIAVVEDGRVAAAWAPLLATA